MRDEPGAVKPLYIVGIGASAGGLEAIRDLLAPARPDAPVAYVVVQHLDPNHDSLLAELLDRTTDLTVTQARDGEKVEAGHVYTIPPGYGLGMSKGRLTLTEFAQPRGLRRPIDDFFESLAQDQRERAICVILSGTGADGSVGLRAVKENGGLCLAQDSSARYDSMPNSAVATGLVDFVCAPTDVVSHVSRFRRVEGNDLAGLQPAAATIDAFCGVLRQRTGHDFSRYKRSTLRRRIQRRMQVLGETDAKSYMARLQADPKEAEALFGDFLINVTRFFRDAAHFRALRDIAIRPLVAAAEPGRELRIWVPGCSSGEEAYSIAMLFAHEIETTGREITFQVFATDIDERMLEIARAARYPLSSLSDVPTELREAYTMGREGSFQIISQLRDLVRFSPHSLIKDPPFSRIDLVSCRNLLIYFDDSLQSRALPIFHYALKPGGYLFLGPSESIGRAEDLFDPADPPARLFRRNNARAAYPIDLPGPDATPRRAPKRSARREAHTNDGTSTVALTRIIDAYAPPTLQVDRNGAVLASTGRLAKFVDLDPADHGPGFAQSIARPGLREAVSALIREASGENARKIARDVEVVSELGRQKVDVLADPLPDDTILLVFRDRAPFEPIDGDDFEALVPSESHVQVLEQELRAARTRLRSTVEELETANEELKSSNEEMMSMNEELQSTNEELATVNDELKSKVEELSSANSDLRNFFQSSALAMVTVESDMRIRNFTLAAQKVFPIRETDRGRPLSELPGTIEDFAAVETATRRVIDTGESEELRVTARGGAPVWLLTISPYRLPSGSIGGASLVFADITEAVQLQKDLAVEGERLRLALGIAKIGIWELDESGERTKVDSRIADFFGMSEPGWHPADFFYRMMPDAEGERVEAEIHRALANNEHFDTMFPITARDGTRRYLRGMGQLLPIPSAGGERRLIGVNLDVTAEVEAAKMRELMLREMNHRVKNLFSIISGMLRLAARNAETPKALVEDVGRRIAALARSHDLTQGGKEGTALEAIVQATIEPHVEHHTVKITGPEVHVNATQLTSLALILHEWATNSAKYGILGPLQGKLEINWHHIDGQDADEIETIELEWNEIPDRAFPTPSDTASHGFGTTLVQLSAAQLGGRVEVDVSDKRRTNRLIYETSKRRSDEDRPGTVQS